MNWVLRHFLPNFYLFFWQIIFRHVILLVKLHDIASKISFFAGCAYLQGMGFCCKIIEYYLTKLYDFVVKLQHVNCTYMLFY